MSKGKDVQWKTLAVEGMDASQKYEVSNYGQIRSFKYHSKGKTLKNARLKGYKTITLRMENGRFTTKYVHKLVAELFLERESEQQNCVIHLDYNKNNNCASNLMWVTRQTMFMHHKFNPNYKRGNVTNSKLTEEQVKLLKLKLNYRNRLTTRIGDIAREFGITHTQLNRIRRGENWAHVTMF